MLTDEELPAIVWATNGDSARFAAMRADDNVDFRAMLAREVYSERMWRIRNVRLTPEGAVLQELIDGAPLRIRVEYDSGEQLA